MSRRFIVFAVDPQCGIGRVLSEPSEEMVERAVEVLQRIDSEGPMMGWPESHVQVREILTAALFSSDAGEREETVWPT